MVSSSASTVTLGVTASKSAVIGTRVLNLNGGAATAHAAVGSSFGGGCGDLEAPAGGVAGCTEQSFDSSCVENGTCTQPNVSGTASDWISVVDIEGGGVSLMFAPSSDATPGQYSYTIDYGINCFLNDEASPCEEGPYWATVDAPQLPPIVDSVTPSQVAAGSTGVIFVDGQYFTGANVSVAGPGLSTTGSGIQVLSDTRISINYTSDAGTGGGPRTITITTPSGTATTVVNVQATIPIKLDFVQTVINPRTNYSEDTTIRVTAMDASTDQPLTSFTGRVYIAEDGTSIYSLNGGNLPPFVDITTGGTVTFVAKSLAGPKTEGANGAPPDPALLKVVNYPSYKAAPSLSVPQWVITATPVDPRATDPQHTYDWFRSRMQDIFARATTAAGDLATVVQLVTSYTLDGTLDAGAVARGNLGGQQFQVIFNPFSARYRLDSAGDADCGLGAPAHDLTDTLYHEARHGYQASLATADNDEDSDRLVNTIRIAPSNIFIDTTDPRTVCDEFGHKTSQMKFNGPNSPDAFGDITGSIKGVGFAIEMDAWMFASQH